MLARNHELSPNRGTIYTPVQILAADTENPPVIVTQVGLRNRSR